MRFWTKKKIIPTGSYKLTLYAGDGNTVILEDVEAEKYEILKSSIGRDVIFHHEDSSINLKHFFMVGSEKLN